MEMNKMSIKITKTRTIETHGSLPDGTQSITFKDFAELIGGLQDGERLRLPNILLTVPHCTSGILRLPAGTYTKSNEDDLVSFRQSR